MTKEFLLISRGTKVAEYKVKLQEQGELTITVEFGPRMLAARMCLAMHLWGCHFVIYTHPVLLSGKYICHTPIRCKHTEDYVGFCRIMPEYAGIKRRKSDLITEDTHAPFILVGEWWI